jgi:rhamnose utilization protein RhaD (predicted bifunctional aldolase and dehydrogenase)
MPDMLDPANVRATLMALSHELGAEHRQLVILGEGNTSAKLADGTFIVKASGSSLGTLADHEIVECRSDPLLSMLDRHDLSDQQIEDELFASRVVATSRKPSIEALFHAYLLSLPGINFVGHTHPVSVNQILCSPYASAFATRRMFPDEIVCCGPTAVLVPYTDPGLHLSQAIRDKVTHFMAVAGTPPRVILLENHGIITLGASPAAVKGAMYMADKGARIFLGAITAGGPRFLEPAQVARIANRIDEHHRQRALGI